jgi:hypothetical protein
MTMGAGPLPVVVAALAPDTDQAPAGPPTEQTGAPASPSSEPPPAADFESDGFDPDAQ